MQPCKFVFEDSPAFEGFNLGSIWHSYNNVAVTPAVRGDIVSYFSARGEPELAEKIAALPVGVDGLVSLAGGFTARIVGAEYPTPQQLADKFVAVLRVYLDDSEWYEMIERNRVETSHHVCHSHDFRDSHRAMSQAWKSFGLPDIDGDNQAQAELWNAAWKIASEEHLGGHG